MAASSRSLLRVLSRCQSQFFPVSCSSLSAHRQLPVRSYAAAAKPAQKEKKEKKEETGQEKVVKEKRKIDDRDRHKPYGLTAWAPLDDVYFVRYYPKPVYEMPVAIEMLKNFQKLDFTPENQPVYINLCLDMKLEKKKKVEPFVSTMYLPHPFKTDNNKVVVFTENPDQARIAMENGATVAGGAELVEKILADEITADFYLAEPDIVQKLLPLKNKLRKKFPKSKRGSVGMNIPKMLALFRTGHEYIVEDVCVNTQIATLDMPKDIIVENIQAVCKDVASHKPTELGPFIVQAVICSRTSEGLCVKMEDLLPEQPEKA
ncbi:39S ribosomal protein L1, mitochondrial [Triplophysa tibetana]|uniref:Large ribosomal subunit protein uL1m n=1 Tax=Triplophysa tibetana TaxID=1572043 RepID=A0A5A9P5S4_9TELE|nr:39S ribosomal protein L1, mitochondrial [Triplophysa tibetana]KAA0717288.1 39S ribosomal protein L1, mitochondrial [Triplophysa tibetana]